MPARRGVTTSGTNRGSFAPSRHADAQVELVDDDLSGEEPAHKAFDHQAADRYELFHITPAENLGPILEGGVREGDGRHWKGNRQHAVYLTDRAGIDTWAKEVRRRGGYDASTEFSVVGVDATKLPPLEWLLRMRRASHAQTKHGYQLALRIVEPGKWTAPEDAFEGIDPDAFEYLGDLVQPPPGRALIGDYFESSVPDYVQSPWVQDGLQVTLVPEDWAAMPTTRVSPTGLHATQSRLIKEHLARHLSANPQSDGEDVPWVVRYRSQGWVVDGHHRIAAAQLRGDDDIEVHLMDLDG